MPEINEDIIADVYKSYRDARFDRLRTEALYDGVKRILLRLNRYSNDQTIFKQHSDIAINELSSYLNRFYHQDTLFIDRLIYEARAYIIEIGERW